MFSLLKKLPFGTPHLRDLGHTLDALIRTKLWIQVLIGMVLGISLGIILGPSFGLIEADQAETIGNWVALPGYLFLILVQMIIVPLVLASVVQGISASEGMSQLKKLGSRVVVYFLASTIVAISIGVGLSLVINPGKYLNQSQLQTVSIENIATDKTLDTFSWRTLPNKVVGILPSNPMDSLVNKEMLQIVLFAIILGLALVALPEKQAKPLKDLTASLQAVCLQIVNWAMKLAPFAVFGLLAQIVIKTGLDVLVGMGVYIATVILGLFILLCLYLLLVYLVAKEKPFSFLRKIREAQLLAFSTSSSAAVMPVSIKTAEDELNVSPSTSEFLIPLGATINMDGTALYQGVSTIFLAQVFGVELGFGALMMVIVTAVGASIGTPSAPGVGIIILSMVLSSVGIPLEGIALIIGVNRILDMFRSTINVTGDLVACTVIDKWIQPKGMLDRVKETVHDKLQR